MKENRLARNTFGLLLSESVSAVFWISAGILAARVLGVSDFGRFTTVVAFAQVLSILVEAGMGQFAAREIADDQRSNDFDLSALASFRLCLLVAGGLAAPWIGRVFVEPHETWRIVFWLTTGILLFSLSDFFCWILKGRQRVAACALLQVGSRALLLASYVFAWRLTHLSLDGLAMAHAAGGLISVIGGLVLLSRQGLALHWVEPRWSVLKRWLPAIYRLGGVLIGMVIFSRIDILLVSRLAGNVAAGSYGLACRVIDAIRLIPTAAYGAMLPIFVALQNDRLQLHRRMREIFAALFIGSVAISLVVTFTAKPLLVHVLGAQYLGSAACLQRLVWSSVFMYWNIAIFACLYARHHLKTITVSIVVGIIFEGGLDFILIPYGVFWAPWVRLAAEAAMFIINLYGLLSVEGISLGEAGA